MERLPQGVFDIIGSFCDFALDEIKIWPAGRPRRNVSSVSRAFAANFYDSILKQKLAVMPMRSVPVWCVLTWNVWDLELRLENFKVWDDEDEEFLDYLLEEFKFWCQQESHFETWWEQHPNSRAELIVYTPPVRIGITTPSRL